ncbi:hypothetical protein AB0J21_07465 [Streptomyces sp. NPDC049954]|uniref:hypothetical protein n=1 Tax=Streptomyces sp. NPDC049954 TaxID=3155779 RepID=UPI00343B77A8
MSVTTRRLAWFALAVAVVLAVGGTAGFVVALVDGWPTSGTLWLAVVSLAWAGICARICVNLRRDAAARR